MKEDEQMQKDTDAEKRRRQLRQRAQPPKRKILYRVLAAPQNSKTGMVKPGQTETAGHRQAGRKAGSKGREHARRGDDFGKGSGKGG